jgi:hypothetical protein
VAAHVPPLIPGGTPGAATDQLRGERRAGRRSAGRVARPTVLDLAAADAAELPFKGFLLIGH